MLVSSQLSNVSNGQRVKASKTKKQTAFTKSNNLKSLAILRSGALSKKLKYFEAILNIFEFSRVWEIVDCRVLIGLCN